MPDYPTLIPKTTTPTPETLPGGGIQLPRPLLSRLGHRPARPRVRSPPPTSGTLTPARPTPPPSAASPLGRTPSASPISATSHHSMSPPISSSCRAAWRLLRSNSSWPRSACFFDWLVVGQIVPTNPASAVRGPKHSLKKGKTPALIAEEARDLLDSIATRSGAKHRPTGFLMTFGKSKGFWSRHRETRSSTSAWPSTCSRSAAGWTCARSPSTLGTSGT